MRPDTNTKYVGLGVPSKADVAVAKAWWRHLATPLPWFVLLVSSALTIFAAYVNYESSEEQNKARFEHTVDELTTAINDHLAAYRNVLYGFSGLVSIDHDIDRRHWKTYYDSLSLNEFYPGFQGIGFARLIEPNAVAAFEAKIQAQGFPDFKVTPTRTRDVVTAIEVLEPFDWRNQRAFGYDMFSNVVRREAMQYAMQTGDVAISGKVTLLQETKDDPQAGFIMYLGHIKRDSASAIGTSDSHFLGWVYAAFRVQDLMDGVFPQRYDQLVFELHDEASGVDTLLYQSMPDTFFTSKFMAQRIIKFGNRQWRLEVKNLPKFEEQNNNRLSVFILVAGMLESFSLFAMALGYVTTRHQVTLKEELFKDKQASEERISVILNSTTTALLATDAEGNIVEVNRQASELFGYARQTLLSMKLEALIPQEFRDNHEELRKQYTKNPVKRNMNPVTELFAQDVRGELIPVEIGLSPIKTDKGLQILATIVDMRESLKAKKEKDRIMEQLEAKNVEMEQFVYTVSHDLKSPLVTISGFTKLLNDSLKGKLDEKQAHWLNRIGVNVKSMEGLLNDLLELSRIIHRELDLESFYIEDACQEVINSLAAQVRACGAKISLDLSVPEITAHRRLLVQCLQNLISNAMQYSKPNELCEIIITSRQEADWVVVTVVDNGIGIAENHQKRIFEIFERLSAKTSSGSGVGLAVVKTAVEKHGGYVTVSSELDQGSEFKLYFPRV